MSVLELTGGPRLRGERINRGLTLRGAAEAIGGPVTLDILSRAEGGAKPHPPQAKQIADYYGLQVTDIWPIEQAAA